MAQVKGWSDVKPYWWCDNKYMHAVENHLWRCLIHHPENGIYIKGIEKSRPESIELSCMINGGILNINTSMSDADLLLKTVESIRIIMEDAIIENAIFKYKKEEHFSNTHTYNLNYKWQHLDKK